MRKETIRFELNKPVEVKFSFSAPIPVTGMYGRQYLYGVKKTGSGRDYSFYATEKLNNLLQSIGKLFSRHLEIEKKEYASGKNYWVIKEKGVDITPH